MDCELEEIGHVETTTLRLQLCCNCLSQICRWIVSAFCMILLFCIATSLPTSLYAQAIPLKYYEQPPLLNQNRQLTLAKRAEWQSFITAHPSWQAYWNETSGTPQRAFGRGIPIEGYGVITSANVEGAARGFIQRYSGAIGASESELRLVRAKFLINKWYVIFQQF